MKTFFLEKTIILGPKRRNLRLNPSEPFIFLENSIILGQNLVFVLESQTIFLSYPQSIACQLHDQLWHTKYMTSLTSHRTPLPSSINFPFSEMSKRLNKSSIRRQAFKQFFEVINTF